MLEFIKPATVPVLVDVAKLIWPAYVRVAFGNLRIEISEADKQRLIALADKRVLICPNHPASEDPAVLFGLSRYLNQRFHYLTAREIFKKHPSLRSRWLQSLGCYSIVRGAADVESFKASRKLLMQASSKVVVFPEGEISHHNSAPMDLEGGIAHLAVIAAQSLKNSSSETALYVVPMALLYRYDEDIEVQLEEILSRVELNLGLVPPANATCVLRIKDCYLSILSTLEHEQNLAPSELSIAQRLARWTNCVLHQVSKILAVDLVDGQRVTTRVHRLKNVLNELRFKNRFSGSFDYDLAEKYRLCYQDLQRVTRFLTIDDSRFNNDLIQEEFAELILLLEEEVTGCITLRANRVVYIGAAEPIEVKSTDNGYDRAQATTALKMQISADIQQTIMRLSKQHPSPI